MSQQKQYCEPTNAPKCSPPKGPKPCLPPCSAPCHARASGSSCLGSLKPRAQSLAIPRKAHRKPRCLSGGAVYHCKEEEC
ncbi:late cornified envelope protein 6A isoform X2 [Tamandua tetradactyla]